MIDRRLAFTLALLVLTVGCQPDTTSGSLAVAQRGVVVEAACGQCQFDLDGTGCDLAIRLDGETWFVDGTAIDDHGDAHAADGFCNAIRSARVTGRVENGRFVATEFELLEEAQD